MCPHIFVWNDAFLMASVPVSGEICTDYNLRKRLWSSGVTVLSTEVNSDDMYAGLSVNRTNRLRNSIKKDFGA